ncbi:hypothetical protein EVG20_g6524, partial [Dentipellis fragilis]
RAYPRLRNDDDDDDEDPFADASAVPIYVPSSAPRRTDVRVEPATVTVTETETVAPAVRDMRARAVACMLLSRGGTGGRPMRRRTPLPRQYVRSGLSATPPSVPLTILTRAPDPDPGLGSGLSDCLQYTDPRIHIHTHTHARVLRIASPDSRSPPSNVLHRASRRTTPAYDSDSLFYVVRRERRRGHVEVYRARSRTLVPIGSRIAMHPSPRPSPRSVPSVPHLHLWDFLLSVYLSLSLLSSPLLPRRGSWGTSVRCRQPLRIHSPSAMLSTVHPDLELRLKTRDSNSHSPSSSSPRASVIGLSYASSVPVNGADVGVGADGGGDGGDGLLGVGSRESGGGRRSRVRGLSWCLRGCLQGEVRLFISVFVPVFALALALGFISWTTDDGMEDWDLGPNAGAVAVTLHPASCILHPRPSSKASLSSSGLRCRMRGPHVRVTSSSTSIFADARCFRVRRYACGCRYRKAEEEVTVTVTVTKAKAEYAPSDSHDVPRPTLSSTFHGQQRVIEPLRSGGMLPWDGLRAVGLSDGRRRVAMNPTGHRTDMVKELMHAHVRGRERRWAEDLHDVSRLGPALEYDTNTIRMLLAWDLGLRSARSGSGAAAAAESGRHYSSTRVGFEIRTTASCRELESSRCCVGCEAVCGAPGSGDAGCGMRISGLKRSGFGIRDLGRTRFRIGRPRPLAHTPRIMRHAWHPPSSIAVSKLKHKRGHERMSSQPCPSRAPHKACDFSADFFLDGSSQHCTRGYLRARTDEHCRIHSDCRAINRVVCAEYLCSPQAREPDPWPPPSTSIFPASLPYALARYRAMFVDMPAARSPAHSRCPGSIRRTWYPLVAQISDNLPFSIITDPPHPSPSIPCTSANGQTGPRAALRDFMSLDDVLEDRRVSNIRRSSADLHPSPPPWHVSLVPRVPASTCTRTFCSHRLAKHHPTSSTFAHRNASPHIEPGAAQS